MLTKDFLLEIGCEELPPRTLNQLSCSLSQNIKKELKKAALSFKSIHRYATPRRLAILIKSLTSKQPSRILERQGPRVKVAFAKDGTPTIPCLEFARSCGVLTDQLQIKIKKKEAFIYCQIEQPGQPTCKLLPEIIQSAIKNLNIPKAMYWGSHPESFVRPVHWVTILLDKEVIPTSILGHAADRKTFGNRFHHPNSISITQPSDYQNLLLNHGMVIVDFNKRRKKIHDLIKKTAASKGEVVINKELLKEVTGMVEWPVALLGHFKPEFLTLPPELLITSIEVQQRCFPVKNNQGDLLPYFILISNISSKNPQCIIKGNERVINARLSDASFFYHNDLKVSLESRLRKLSGIMFHHQLGSLADKTTRILKLTNFITKNLKEVNKKLTQRAALLAKCDLVTEIVCEFPSLQGTMGYHYALHDKESEIIAQAIKDHYLPRFSGNKLPGNLEGVCVGLADRLDTLIGIIGINKSPTGHKDPFGLRRAALGILRLLIEKELPLDLLGLLKEAEKNYINPLPNQNVVNQSLDFIIERLRSWYIENNVSPSVFMAVLATHPTEPLDFDRRIKAIQYFQTLPSSSALTAAYKRVSNILKKQSFEITADHNYIDTSLFDSDAEHDLVEALKIHSTSINNLYKKGDYTKALSELPILTDLIDKFFDKVMVMVNDTKKRHNRLAILTSLQQLFTKIADFSLLI
ncbi:Glycyl-tRNA synthetase beta chain [Coxiella-like endosymbiont]|uniref:glycine--tRNA ligase subunit beta n=1 Tax=Coxiella endosymbiont of Rhipicephalus microplus TaxID=1656186 RepID=UPI000C81000A|nr:glycine--tRNA ligase subunit beta [Coxiella endosymbiont of Rhipicephalus microplus]PMB54753.1 Glycyl-tRNA synthetase beta chain [Coxiella-like endosymbiont]